MTSNLLIFRNDKKAMTLPNCDHTASSSETSVLSPVKKSKSLSRKAVFFFLIYLHYYDSRRSKIIRR